MENTNIVKYPKSKTGKQCLGPCNKPNEPTIHPYTLDFVYSAISPYCATAPYELYDSYNNKYFIEYIDECYLSRDIKNNNENNYLEPNIYIEEEQFLKYYYNINNFNDVVNYLKEKNPPLTKLRIVQNGLIAFNKSIDYIDDYLIEFFIEISSKIWIYDLYKVIVKYIVIKNNEIFLNFSNNVISNKLEDKTIIYKFIIRKFCNKNFIYKFIDRTLINKNINDDIKLIYIKYILNKIKKSNK